MKHFHILSVGIVLATALCSPAKALDVPLLDSPVWVVSEEVPASSLQKAPAPYPMTYLMDQRERNLKLVYEVASEVGNQEVLQAMLLQETNGGTHPTLIGNPNAPVSKRSYGLMQVQVVAARSVLQRYPNLMDDYYPNRHPNQVSDVEIIQLLMKNSVANIRFAAYHFDLYLKLLHGNLDHAVAAYNVGIGGVRKLKSPSRYKYVVEVKQKLMMVVKPFNAMYGLTTTSLTDTKVVTFQ